MDDGRRWTIFVHRPFCPFIVHQTALNHTHTEPYRSFLFAKNQFFEIILLCAIFFIRSLV